MFLYAKWLPKTGFSTSSFFQLFKYSWKLTAGWIIGTIYQDVFSFVIGKEYDETILGYYSKGNSIPNVINRIVTQVTSAVMFPVISKVQDDKDMVKKQTRGMVSVSAAMIFPVMAFVAGATDPIVRLVLTEKWLPIVPIIQIFCISSSINVVSNANMQSFNAIGHSDVFFITELIKRGITILLVILLVKVDFYLMLFSIAFMGLVSLTINGYFNYKYLSYRVKDYLSDIIPSILFAIGMFYIIYICNYIINFLIIRLIVQMIAATAMYFIVAKTQIVSPCSQVWNVLLTTMSKFVKIKGEK